MPLLFGIQMGVFEVHMKNWFAALLQDLQYGLRMLRKSPGFTAVAVLSLSLGIGANTAIFSLLNAVMLRSLPVQKPEQIFQVKQGTQGWLTNPIWEALRDRQGFFSGAFAWSPTRFNLAPSGESKYVQGLWASGELFKTLGVPAVIGRTFKNEDDQRGGGKSGLVAVLSYAFWRRHYGGDPSVLGKTIHLDRQPFQIIGVTPSGFFGMDVGQAFDVAVPIGCLSLFQDGSMLENRSAWWLNIAGRLAPGVTPQQADTQLKVIGPQILQATLPDWSPEMQKDYLKNNNFNVQSASTGLSQTRGQYRVALLVLMTVVGLVLLIACGNIANLLLARATVRQREIAVRLSLGAGRGRIMRQLLTESILLSILGAASGLLFSQWSSQLLVRLLSTARDQVQLDLSLDGRVLAFTTGVAVLTGILFGLAPALRGTGFSPNSVLKENARGAIGSSSKFGLGKVLVVGQVALSLLLLVGASLFVRSLYKLLTLDAGFERENVLLVSTHIRETSFQKERRIALHQEILDRLRALPGVQSASSVAYTPLSGAGWNNLIEPEGYQAKSKRDTIIWMNRISPRYFETMGTPVLVGRDFGSQDTENSPRVIIINESTARHFFSGQNPLGKIIRIAEGPRDKEKVPFQVIGVVKDMKYRRLSEENSEAGYVVARQDKDPSTSTHFALRFAGNVDAFTPSVRTAIAGINRDISLEFRSFETQVNDSLAQQRLIAILSSFFGFLALLLAVIGLYGIMSYTVTRRQAEIGIRMALGAEQSSVRWLILRQSLTLIAVGLGTGLLLSIGLTKFVKSLLFGLTPTDPLSLTLASVLLFAVALLASYLPARRASHIDPMEALRYE